MNILVTGANGQLGTELRKLSEGESHRFIFTDVNDVPGYETVFLDITDINAIRVIAESEKVDLIINCAAYTNVDKAEDDLDFADMLNHKAAENLAKVCAGRDATLVHISTDYVFNGNGCVPVRETDIPDPRSVYGSTKLAGEISVKKSGCNYIIIRTAWLYSVTGKNFVKTMRALTSERDNISVVFDQVGSPTSAADLAGAIMHIVKTGQLSKKGVYHFSNEGAVSWYDFACAIRDLSGNRCNIRPCLSGEFSSKVNRPHYSVLDKSLIKNTFGLEIPYWQDSLKTVIDALDNN